MAKSRQRPWADPLPGLYEYLVNHMYEVPGPMRYHYHWVMNQDWYDECRKIAGPGPRFTIMLGLPLVVRDDGGIPHLVD